MPGAACDGKPVKDPTFGLDAMWIAQGDPDAATGLGYLVVDPGTVVATHLNQCLIQNASRPARPGRSPGAARRAQGTRGAVWSPRSRPAPVPLTTLTKVLRGLLAESIPLKEFRRIAAAIAAAAQRTLDADELMELIRPELGPLIIQRLCGVREPLRVMTLEGQLEGVARPAVRSDPSRRHTIEPSNT